MREAPISSEKHRSDEQLLLSGDPEDFGEFYRRHARPLLGYFARRTGDPESAADLVAETFAAAIVARRRFKPGAKPAAAWLYGIASHKLTDCRRRGYAEARALHRLGLERPVLTDSDVELVRAAAEEVSLELIGELPATQRDAVRAHVLEDRGYGEIATARRTSEQVVRQRVSRGLAQLRATLSA